MTPAAAFEYVRSSRPRVLLAASQWQAVQDYHRRRVNRLPLIKTPASLLAESSDLDNLPESSNNWSESGDRSIVLVTDSDLEGYGPEQAGLVGNDLWAELGLACRVRLVARSAVSGVGLVRFSTLWLGCRVGAKISPEKLVMAGKLAGNPAMEGMDIPVF
ncbi:putative dual specificity protein phosphatase DSP8 [Amborella trichopoda]|uniref:putative dual specificity protein phosphatase DSP8 n=1 Tax=Amborella trichopoda TaxID=13333 RepID=UPI0005D393E3|nr:putative dual specificity protein phosphatase DSP8 [Amborella trichopoda]|eukprot:XP_011621180.1 putative dual specificity protein phosphatase DSP8 [Amborella trichopoda]